MTSHARRKASNSVRNRSGPADLRRSTSATSPPAQKFLPAPRMTITFTAGSLDSSLSACSSWRASSVVIAFMRSGRFSVTCPIPSAITYCTTLTCSPSIIPTISNLG